MILYQNSTVKQALIQGISKTSQSTIKTYIDAKFVSPKQPSTTLFNKNQLQQKNDTIKNQRCKRNRNNIQKLISKQIQRQHHYHTTLINTYPKPDEKSLE
jgi:hypothetical protein